MAWRGRITFATGDKPTAAEVNGLALDTRKPGGDVDMLGTANGGPYRIDGMKGYTAPGQPAVLAVHHTPLFLTSGLFLASPGLPFDNDSAGIAYNIGGMHSTGSNPSRLTATVAGRFQIGGVIGFAANATGTRNAKLMKNGATLITQANMNAVTGGLATFLHMPTLSLLMAVNDYVEFLPMQDSGGLVATLADVTLGWMIQVS